jgi:hypothetical protein
LSQVFIIGFGKFGQLTLPKVSQRWPKARIWIMDPVPEHLTRGERFSAVRVLDKGEDFLWKHQNQLASEDWIIPAVPFHLAGDWVKRVLSRDRAVRKIKPPRNLGKGLPFTLYLNKDFYVSLADFECPENCPSPQGFCFKTRDPRPQRLREILDIQSLSRGTLTFIKSEQLAPGLGGFTFGELKRTGELLLRADPPLFLATVCPCHGVISGFTW